MKDQSVNESVRIIPILQNLPMWLFSLTTKNSKNNLTLKIVMLHLP